VQDQNIGDSQIRDSQIQLVQAGRDAVSFQNSHENQVTINNALLQFGPSAAPAVDWTWAQRLLSEKQLPEIRKRLTDTLGRERALMAVDAIEEPCWVGRLPLEAKALEAKRVLQVEGQAEDPLDPRQMMIETLGRDDIAGKLLILGTPGSGKTTALLSLAEQLVMGALQQPRTVIPVLFELSTWRQDGQSIRDWLVEQLYEQHGGNRKAKLYEQWLDQQVLLPLMDGLDELSLHRQQKCMQKLQDFARQYPQLVVCCRTQEFAQAGIKLDTLRGAIRLEPLSDDQIQAFLTQQQSPLWSMLQASPHLRQLLESTSEEAPGLLRVPLFITLAVRTYDSKHPFQNKADLLNQYIDRQLSHDVREHDRRSPLQQKHWAYKTLGQEPTCQKTQRTLSWLARQLQQNNQVELLIERIQPCWLATPPSRRHYRLILMLILMLIFYISSVSFYELVDKSSYLRSAYESIYESYIELIVGLISGLVVAFYRRNDIVPIEALKFSLSTDVRQTFLYSLRRNMVFSMVMGTIGSSLYWLVWWVITGADPSIILGLFIMLVLGLILGLIVGLTMMPTVGLIQIIKHDLKTRLYPNQGIWKSLQNFIWTTILAFLLFSFVSYILISPVVFAEFGSTGGIFIYLRAGLLSPLLFFRSTSSCLCL
jgi:DNA polymerase III delta prime subunit